VASSLTHDEITRATVLEICSAENIACVEADLTLDDVYRADRKCSAPGQWVNWLPSQKWMTGSLATAPLVRRQNG